MNHKIKIILCDLNEKLADYYLHTLPTATLDERSPVPIYDSKIVKELANEYHIQKNEAIWEATKQIEELVNGNAD
jgi:hypothetical protein